MFNPFNSQNSSNTHLQQDTHLQQVLNGDFPREALRKMNRKRLEKFVLQLVECSSDVGAKDAKDFTGLYRGLCLKEINKPEWWPSERIISQSLTTDGKYFMELMRFLVYKCCEFFKKPSENLNTEAFVTENDENSRGVKRKCCEPSCSEIPSKRRTLMPQNVTSKSSESIEKETIIKNPVIQLKDIFYKPKPKVLTQDAFLNIFGLQNTFDHDIEDPVVPAVLSSSIKFNSCSVIPFSSDLGLELMKRDNHNCPEALKSRRLEKLEWYVNKTPPRYNEITYEVTYQEKKDTTFRSYKFPKRQIWQHPGDMIFQKKALFCQRLTIVLIRQDLEALQKKLRRKVERKLRVIVSRMPVQSKKPPVKKKRSIKK